MPAFLGLRSAIGGNKVCIKAPYLGFLASPTGFPVWRNYFLAGLELLVLVLFVFFNVFLVFFSLLFTIF